MKSIAEQQQQKIWSIEKQSHFHLIFDPFLILNLENLVFDLNPGGGEPQSAAEAKFHT